METVLPIRMNQLNRSWPLPLIILAAGGKHLATSDLRVWGFTAWNDLSIRDGRLGIGPELHRGAFNWAVEKNFDTGNPCGPCVVVDEGYDVNDLRCTMRVNGEVRQGGSITDMVLAKLRLPMPPMSRE